MSELTVARQAVAHRGRRLEYFTIVWNTLEGLIAVAAGVLAGSISLVGFGMDSFIEVTSGTTLLWRMSVDADVASRERNEKLSLRIVGFCFIALAVYITYEALAYLSLIVMPILSSTKKRVGSALNSAAMKADTWQTDFSIYPESSACKQSLSRNFDCFLSMRAAPCAASCPPPITGGKQCGNAHQQRLTNAQATD